MRVILLVAAKKGMITQKFLHNHPFGSRGN